MLNKKMWSRDFEWYHFRLSRPYPKRLPSPIGRGHNLTLKLQANGCRQSNTFLLRVRYMWTFCWRNVWQYCFSLILHTCTSSCTLDFSILLCQIRIVLALVTVICNLLHWYHNSICVTVSCNGRFLNRLPRWPAVWRPSLAARRKPLPWRRQLWPAWTKPSSWRWVSSCWYRD